MPNYSDKQLQEITNLAALFLSPKEIAVMMEWDEDLFLNDVKKVGNAAYVAYQKGRLQSEVDIRTSVIKMAKAGSTPAQAMALKFLSDLTIKENDF